MNKGDLLQLPQKIKVSVKLGKSGVLLAELPEYDVFTEADNLNHLFLQVNDLIYTFFDVPKKLQGEVHFIPPVEEQQRLIKLVEENKSKVKNKFDVSVFYSPDVFETNWA